MARGLLGAESVNGLRHNRSFALKNADVVILVGVVCDFRLDYGRSIRFVLFIAVYCLYINYFFPCLYLLKLNIRYYF